jgi:1-acyl-sn-glycerol-3-phosphate acyltransferase
MLQPTEEQLSALSRLERAAFRIGDVFSRHPNAVAKVNDTVMAIMIWSCGGRRIRVHGLEHLAGFGDRDSLLVVSNHRSFFDFYVVAAVLFWKTTLPRRLFFPVRSTFFYDHPLGPPTNIAMSCMRMFPPIMRDKDRASFNLFSVQRCVAELEVPGTIMGLHPEGTRNKGDDPYSFLPAQSGVGKIALDAAHARVVPVFVHGLSNSLGTEFTRNWRERPEANVIDVMFGPEVPMADLRASTARAASLKRAANRALDGIKKLAEEHRAGLHTEKPRPVWKILAREGAV